MAIRNRLARRKVTESPDSSLDENEEDVEHIEVISAKRNSFAQPVAIRNRLARRKVTKSPDSSLDENEEDVEHPSEIFRRDPSGKRIKNKRNCVYIIEGSPKKSANWNLTKFK